MNMVPVAIVGTAMLTGLTIPLWKRAAVVLHLQASPDARHARPIPTIGGIAIVTAIVTMLVVLGNCRTPTICGVILLCILGVIDDAVELKPAKKLLGEVAIIAPTVLMSGRFNLFPWPWADVALTVFWLLSCTNAFNLIDGLDGLAGGTAVVICTVIGSTVIIDGNPGIAIEAFTLAGAMLGFLAYNFAPASVFMGDGGALPVGFFLGSLALQGRLVATNGWLSAYTFPVLVMMVPLMDTIVVSASRIVTGSPVSRRGLDHSHHRLLALGLSEKRVVILCWIASAAVGGLAIAEATLSFGNALGLLPFVAIAIVVVGMFMVDLTFDTLAPGRSYPELNGVGRVLVRLVYKWRIADVALDLLVICAAYLGAFLFRLDFFIPSTLMPGILRSLPYVCLIASISFLLAGVYRGIWRFVGLSEMMRFAKAALISGALLFLASRFLDIALSGSVLVMFSILLLNLLAATRISFRMLHRSVRALATPSRRVLIVGAGRIGAAAAEMLFSNHHRGVLVIGFADDDPFKARKWVHGCPVLGSLDQLESIYRKTVFNEILIATRALSPTRRDLLSAFASERGLTADDVLSSINAELKDPQASSTRATTLPPQLALPRTAPI